MEERDKAANSESEYLFEATSLRAGYQRVNSYASWYSEVLNGVYSTSLKGAVDIYQGYYYSSNVYESLTRKIEEALSMEDVKGIVIIFNSPGGDINSLYACGEYLLKARESKPILAIVEHQACSAAYLLAACCSKISINQYGEVGACGVQICTTDTTKYEERIGILRKIFTSRNAPKKNLSPNSKEGAEAIQKRVDYFEASYFELVAKGRSLDKDDCIERFGKGAVLTAEEALEAGMVDKIQSNEDAFNEFAASLEDSSSDGGGLIGNLNSKGSLVNLKTESKGENMEQKTAMEASLKEQIRSEAIAEERARVTALTALKTPETSSIIEDAISSGKTVAEVYPLITAALMDANKKLQEAGKRMGPIEEQHKAQTDLSGIPSGSKPEDVNEYVDACIAGINKAMEESR